MLSSHTTSVYRFDASHVCICVGALLLPAPLPCLGQFKPCLVDGSYALCFLNAF